MRNRLAILLVFLTSLFLAACGSTPPPAPPIPAASQAQAAVPPAAPANGVAAQPAPTVPPTYAAGSAEQLTPITPVTAPAKAPDLPEGQMVAPPKPIQHPPGLMYDQYILLGHGNVTSSFQKVMSATGVCALSYGGTLTPVATLTPDVKQYRYSLPIHLKGGLCSDGALLTMANSEYAQATGGDLAKINAEFKEQLDFMQQLGPQDGALPVRKVTATFVRTLNVFPVTSNGDFWGFCSPDSAGTFEYVAHIPWQVLPGDGTDILRYTTTEDPGSSGCANGALVQVIDTNNLFSVPNLDYGAASIG